MMPKFASSPVLSVIADPVNSNAVVGWKPIELAL